MKYVIIEILVLVVFYLALSFVALDLNFKNWSEGMRVAYVILSIPFSMIVFSCVKLLEDK